VKHFVRNPVIWAVVLAFVLFLALDFVLPRAMLFQIANSMAIAVSAGILVAYAPGFRESLTQSGQQRRSGNLLLLGILFVWGALFFRLAWQMAWRWMGQPAEWMDHLAYAAAVVAFIVGGVLHLAAARAIDGTVPRQSWIRTGILVAFGVFAGAVSFLWLG